MRLALPSASQILGSPNHLQPEEEEEKALVPAGDFEVFTRLDRVTASMVGLEQESARLRAAGQAGSAEETYRQALVMRREAAELVGAVPHLTTFDVTRAIALFHPPVNEVYEHTDRTRYYAPDSSQIMVYIAQFKDETEFEGYGLGQAREAVHPRTGRKLVCDVIYVRKKKDQIQYEMGDISPLRRLSDRISNFLPAWSSGASKIRERQAIQWAKFENELAPRIRDHLEQWKYRKCLCYTSPSDFLKQECVFHTSTEEERHTYYVIVLYYKQIKKED